MRIAIFGATGAVGSALLIHMLKGADLHAGDELVLIGRGNAASTAKLMAMRTDLLDAFDAGIIKLDICSSLDALEAIDVFIMAAGATISRSIQNRSELANRNAPLFHDVARRLSSRCPDALVLIISNPVELAVGVFAEYIDRKRIFGMGAQQDSLRFARAIAARLHVSRSAVRASVVGEHGDGMVPLWSSVYIVDEGADVTSRLNALRNQYTGGDSAVVSVQAIQQKTEDLLGQCEIERAYLLQQTLSPRIRIQVEPLITARTLRSTPNATANATLDCIAAIRQADGRRVHGQVLLQGEFYDLFGITGVPLFLQRSRWHLGLYQPLIDSELDQLKRACASVSQKYASLLNAKLTSRAPRAE